MKWIYELFVSCFLYDIKQLKKQAMNLKTVY